MLRLSLLRTHISIASLFKRMSLVSNLGGTFINKVDYSTATSIKNLKLPYETSIATVSLPKACIYSRLQAIKDAGFSSFELMELDLPEIMSDLDGFKKSVEDMGLRISIFQPFRDFEGDWEFFDERVEEFKKRLEIMKYLNSDLILLCSNCQPFSEFDEERFISQLNIAADLAAEYDINIAYEALSWGTHYKTLEHSWDIVKKVNRVNFGICLDSFHIFIHNCDINIIKQMKDKIFFIQLSDSEFKMNLPDIIYQSRSYRNLPFQGSFKNLELLKVIDEVGYNGPLSLECFSEVLRSFEDLNYSAQESHRSLIYLITELMKLKKYSLPQELTHEDGKIFGFKLLDDFPSNGVIDYTDPLVAFPKVELIVDDDSLFESRSELFSYDDDDILFKNITNFDKNSKDIIIKKLVIDCCRFTYNSLTLYFKSVLHIPEDVSSQTFTSYGLSNTKTFTDGNIKIVITSLHDNKPILKNTV